METSRNNQNKNKELGVEGMRCQYWQISNKYVKQNST